MAKDKPEPVLDLNFLSHGTLESYDIDKSREFYEGFLGLEVIRTSPASLMIRLGGNNTIAVVRNPRKQDMPLLNHNGLDLETQEEVDDAYERVMAHKDEWGVTGVNKPKLQHGTYSFYFRDPDKNWWEILTNPQGGYSWLYEKGDLEGKGHLDKTFERPGVKTPTA